MRCFISIEFPEHVRSKIFHAFEDLNKSGYCSGSFVGKDNLHLTLSFLGDISEEKAERVRNLLKKINFRKFSIETGDIGFFPSESHINTIWVSVISKEISVLKKEIEKILEGEGISLDERDFIPHLTVARIKNIKDKQNFLDYVSGLKLQKMLFVAEDFALMKSILKKDGPEYKIIERYGMRIRG